MSLNIPYIVLSIQKDTRTAAGQATGYCDGNCHLKSLYNIFEQTWSSRAGRQSLPPTSPHMSNLILTNFPLWAINSRLEPLAGATLIIMREPRNRVAGQGYPPSRQLVFRSGFTIFSSQSWGLVWDVSFMKSVKLKGLLFAHQSSPLLVLKTLFNESLSQLLHGIFPWSWEYMGAVSNSTYSISIMPQPSEAQSYRLRGYNCSQ